MSGIIFIVCFLTQSVFASNILTTPIKDSSAQIEVRTFSSAQLDKYKHSSDFQYIRNTPEVSGWWDRVKQWFWQKVFDLIHFGTQTNGGRTILILLIIAFIIYMAYRMTGVEKTGLWGKKNKEVNLMRLSEDNIHVIDFEQAISDAVRQNNFRMAIRLWYLRTLKNLAEKELINWKPGRTNYEYVTELKQTAYADIFKKLTYDFEYCWYGEVAVTPSNYMILKERFSNFNQQL